MTRRQRHIHIIENFGSLKYDRHVQFHFNGVIAKLGLAALNDAAIEMFARNLVESRARQNAMTKENRKRKLATAPK